MIKNLHKKAVFLCLATVLCLAYYSRAFALKRILYNDAGISADTLINTWDSFRGWGIGIAPATFEGSYAGGVPLDPAISFQVRCNNINTYAGFGIFKATGTPPVNMSSYAGGYLKFWIKAADDLKVEIADSSSNHPKNISQYGWSVGDAGTWKEISIPLNDFGSVLSDTTGFFLITVDSPTGSTKEFFVDYVRWTDTLVEAHEWDAELKNIVGGSAASSLSWGSITAGMDQYDVANQYIEVTMNITTPITWRMILYTNNTNYTGDTSAGGYGLVGANTSQGLPLAWKVTEDSLGSVDTPVFSLSRAADDTEGFTDYMWKFVVDQAQTGTYAWDANDTYVRVWDNSGFYWNEGTGPDMDPDPGIVAPCPAPSLDEKVFIYIGAGFHQSFTQPYATTSLILEMLVL